MHRGVCVLLCTCVNLLSVAAVLLPSGQTNWAQQHRLDQDRSQLACQCVWCCAGRGPSWTLLLHKFKVQASTHQQQQQPERAFCTAAVAQHTMAQRGATSVEVYGFVGWIASFVAAGKKVLVWACSSAREMQRGACGNRTLYAPPSSAAVGCGWLQPMAY